MTRRKNYNAGSVWRALENHREAGALEFLSILDDDGPAWPKDSRRVHAPITPTGNLRLVPDDADDLSRKTKFRVKPYNFGDYLDLNLDGAHALVIGLTTGKRFYLDRDLERSEVRHP